MKLSERELAVLAAVHRADEEEGGLALATSDLSDDERDALDALVRAGLVELTHIAHDDANDAFARISAHGVEALRDAGLRP
jgi:hypothetical protein